MKLSVYIHIPFCISKCKYCDFKSNAVGYMEEKHRKKTISAYVERICHEIGMYGKKLKRGGDLTEIESLFLGGGTPSLISVRDFERIMTTVKENFSFSHDCEITMEMNPETVNAYNADAYTSSGLNRVSMGVQSFDDCVLKTAGRVHNSSTVYRAADIVRRSGIKNINLDLIVGLSGQSVSGVRNDIKNICDINPDHVSVYALQLEENTEYERLVKAGKISVPNDDEVYDMFCAASEMLKDSGYLRYEISNFAKEGYESRHNLNCWKNREYIGIGLGAHGYLNGVRYENTSDPDDYAVKTDAGQEVRISEETVGLKDDAFNQIMLGLRLVEGIDLTEFEKKFGFDFSEVYGEKAHKLIRRQLAEYCTHEGINKFRLTSSGLEIQNYCLEELLL